MRLFSGHFHFCALALLVAASGLGCGRTNKVYPDRTATGTSADGTTVTADGRDLPKDFANQSANSGSAVLTSGKEIELKTLAGEKAVGAFHGSGTGNLAVLGLTAYDQTRLADFSPFKFDFKSILGEATPSAVLLVDLECDAVSPVRALFAENLAGLDGEFKSVDVSTQSSVWKVKGADLRSSQAEVLVSAATNGTLEKLMNAYPNACIRNAANTEETLPQLPTAGVMITLGSPTNIEQNHILIRRIEVGTKVFDSAGWGS